MAKITSTTRITIRIISKMVVPIQNLRSRGCIRDYYIRTTRRRTKEKDAALPEYDPLADLYDLEYPHDYDLPFWLSLAGREGGPMVEWGAGTGRLAVPLSEAEIGRAHV